MKGILRAIPGILLMLGLLASAACAPSAAPAASPTAAKPAAASSPAAPAAKATESTSAAAKPAAGSAEWDNVVAAAKKEGKVGVVVASGTGYEAVIAAFQKAYPDIKVEPDYQHGSEFRPKVAAERGAGQYLRDVYIGSPSIVWWLQQEHYLAPLKPQLMLPEVLDDSKWWRGVDGGFMDKDKSVLMFGFSIRYSAWVNRDVVPESELKTVDELIDPKWGNKIALLDPRVSGSGRQVSAVFLRARGEDFLRKLYSQPLALTKDYRQIAEWAIRGRNPIGIGLADYVLVDLEKEGLPTKMMKPLAPDTELGADISPQNGGLGVFERAAHPNATKVFANWLLTKDAQTVWVKNVEQSTRRLDAPAGPAQQHPDVKKNYSLPHAEENLHWSDDVAKIAEQTLK